MNNLNDILDCLEKAPGLLRNLLADVPADLLKKRRIPGKWTIHEHACHVATVDRELMLPRWQKFESEPRPKFVFFAGETISPDHYLNMDLNESLATFAAARAELLAAARAVADPTFWSREADHPEYTLYTPAVMLRHVMMHDHLHMYRIEELLITRDDYLPKGSA
jgi:uncharacterized damage-inducible protein DinB